MMKYMFAPQIDIVPEWKECYYDNKSLTKLVHFIQRINTYIRQIQKAVYHFLNMAKIKKQLNFLKFSQYLSRWQFQLKFILYESNKKFYEYSQHLMQTIFCFIQYKHLTLKSKIDRIMVYGMYLPHKDKNLMALIQNTFVQIYYLKRMIKFNRESQSMLVRQYQLNLYDYQSLYKNEPISRKMDRIQFLISKTLFKLQKIYKINQDNILSQQISRKINLGYKKRYYRPKQTQIIGFLMGLCLIAFSVVLFIRIHLNITLDSNKTFEADFPIWRGASYFIAIQWIMGFCLFFLQQTHLNYKLILNLSGKSLPRSRQLFIGATVTTLIYFLLMSLYFLDMAQIIKGDFRYYGYIMWLVQIIYFLVPLPFANNQGKIFFLKLMALTILAPFAFIKSSIQIVWMSQQLVSFSQPFSDFAYTVCKLNNYNNQCDVMNVSLAILLILFSYRVIINCKLLNQKGWILLAPYYGTFRAFSACITAIMSYVFRKYSKDSLFVLFIVSAVISTSIAIYADFRGDWSLLRRNQWALRKKLYFEKKYFYYICMVVDIILRCNWTLNLSPAVVKNLAILPYYLIMIVTYLQLIRRGIWNIFWLQCFHIQNCDKFMATVDDSQIQLKMQKKCPQNIYMDPKSQQTQQTRNKAQMQLVTQKINTKKDMKKQLLRFINSHKQKLKQTQKLLKQISKNKTL